MRKKPKRLNKNKVLSNQINEIDQQLQDEYDYLIEIMEEIDEICGANLEPCRKT